MDKERAGVQELVVVDLPPLVGGGPGGIALLGQRIRRRAKAEQVQEQRLVIALPAIRQEAALRLPPVRDRRAAVLRPCQSARRYSSSASVRISCSSAEVVPEIGRRRQHARQQKRRIDRGQLTLPDTPSGLHIEEMVIEAFVARGLRLPPLGAVVEEPQGCERSFRRPPRG